MSGCRCKRGRGQRGEGARSHETSCFRKGIWGARKRKTSQFRSQTLDVFPTQEAEEGGWHRWGGREPGRWREAEGDDGLRATSGRGRRERPSGSQRPNGREKWPWVRRSAGHGWTLVNLAKISQMLGWLKPWKMKFKSIGSMHIIS